MKQSPLARSAAWYGAAVVIGWSGVVSSGAVPDHPIITEVYTDPSGAADAPIGRNPANVHQEYIEIWLPTEPDLDPGLNPDALRLTFYEVEGDASSSGAAYVNYRFDLPTFCVRTNPAMCPMGTIPRPPSGVVVLAWVDYAGSLNQGTCAGNGQACDVYLDNCTDLSDCVPPSTSDLAGTPSTRVALIDGGITGTGGAYVLVAINGHHFTGTTNFPLLDAESLIHLVDPPTETSSGVIQNGSGAYLLVNRDDPGYVELYDDKDPAHVPPLSNADPDLPGGSVLMTSALLDGFAGNDDSLFDVTMQPLPLGGCPSNCHTGCNNLCIDHQMTLHAGGAFSNLIAQIPEETTAQPAPGIANGYARVYVDVPKTTENATPADDNPATDAQNAYRHVRNEGPFFPTPGTVVLTTSPPELGVEDGTGQELDVLSQTTRLASVIAANVGGNFPINISSSGGTSSNPAVATFGPGTTAMNVGGQSFGVPTVEVTAGASAADGATATADVTIVATNSNGGDPAVIAPVQTATLIATAINPTTGQDANGQPFETTVFAAVQGVPAGPQLNELLLTDFGAYVAAHLGDTVFDSVLSHGATLVDPTTDMTNGALMHGSMGFPGLIEGMPADCADPAIINPAGPPGGNDVFQTVLQSAEVVSLEPSYDSSLCIPQQSIVGVQFRFSTPSIPRPDMQTFGGAFSPSESLFFADALGGVNTAGSPLNDVTTTRTFELAILDTNARSNSTPQNPNIENPTGDDFGILLRVQDTELGSPFVDGDWVFLSFTGGKEGADIDSLSVPPGDNVLTIIYVDLDNLHDVLGIKSISRVVVIDAEGGSAIDVVEVFDLNPVGVAQCTTNPECDDGNACTTDQCVSGTCTNTPVTAGTTCGSGPTACSAQDTCNATGQCLPNDMPDGTSCPGDGNACTADVCGSGICTHPNEPPGTFCGAGPTDCSAQDTCDAVGQCQPNDLPDGPAPPGLCDDGNDCTQNTCLAGACNHPFEPVDTPCGAGPTPCSGQDTCDAAGQCQPHDLPDGTPCPDGLFCNGDELCAAGVCAAGTPPCPPPVCDENGDVCTGCQIPGDCDDLNECTTDSCDQQTQNCINTPNDGAPCDAGGGPDSGTCDATGTCVTNGCVANTDCGPGGLFDDQDACTDDVCDPANVDAGADGCVHTCVPVLYGDIWPRSKGGDGIVEVSDLLCVLAANNGNPDDGPSSPNTTPLGDCGTLADNDIAPCPPGNDGINEVGDLTALLAAAAGTPPCPDPCVCGP
ncbi:MAG: hypothetical protein ACE5E6_04740 [Phycisphaerae bacterium]